VGSRIKEMEALYVVTAIFSLIIYISLVNTYFDLVATGPALKCLYFILLILCFYSILLADRSILFTD
jgi:uncharacterized membrane protein SirB2